MIHVLKTNHKYFVDVQSGIKTVEIRVNDRGYKVGDHLVLLEYLQEKKCFTEQFCLREVTHMLDEQPFVPEGYVAMSIKPC
jgi:ASC-1-like (ASCH) protein